MSGSIVNSPEGKSTRNYSTDDSSANWVSHNSGCSELSLSARVEALLFVSPSPVAIGQLANALHESSRKIDAALAELNEQYAGRGIRIQHHAGKIQLTSAPEAAGDVERFLNLESTFRLTSAALEVMAIIVYQQPITRPQIDAIRGVNSDSVLRTLTRYCLIEEIGRSPGPGRPILYSVTPDFLQHFGLNSIEELPPLGLEVADATKSLVALESNDESGE